MIRILLALLLATAGQAATVIEIYGPFRGYWLDVDATAYSINDIDGNHNARGKPGVWAHRTGDGVTDTRKVPYGVAVSQIDRGGRLLPVGSRIVIPWGLGYLDRIRVNDRVFPVDDVGGFKRRSVDGALRIDVRFKDRASAVEWAGPTGHRQFRVFVLVP